MNLSSELAPQFRSSTWTDHQEDGGIAVSVRSDRATPNKHARIPPQNVTKLNKIPPQKQRGRGRPADTPRARDRRGEARGRYLALGGWRGLEAAERGVLEHEVALAGVLQPEAVGSDQVEPALHPHPLLPVRRGGGGGGGRRTLGSGRGLHDRHLRAAGHSPPPAPSPNPIPPPHSRREQAAPLSQARLTSLGMALLGLACGRGAPPSPPCAALLFCSPQSNWIGRRRRRQGWPARGRESRGPPGRVGPAGGGPLPCISFLMGELYTSAGLFGWWLGFVLRSLSLLLFLSPLIVQRERGCCSSFFQRSCSYGCCSCVLPPRPYLPRNFGLEKKRVVVMTGTCRFSWGCVSALGCWFGEGVMWGAAVQEGPVATGQMSAWLVSWQIGYTWRILPSHLGCLSRLLASSWIFCRFERSSCIFFSQRVR